MAEFRPWTEPVRPGALSLGWEKQENAERLESELRLASCQWDKLQAGGEVPAYTAQLIFISVIPPQQRLKAPFLLKRRRVVLLKLTWVLDNLSNYRKLYLQWASYFLVQRNKAFISCSLPLPVTAVEGNVFLNGALSGPRLPRTQWQWAARIQTFSRCEGQAQPGLLTQSSQRLGFLYFFSLVCLFLPRIYVPSHVLCAFFWALFFNYLLFFLKQTNMCDGHSVNSYFFPNLFLNFFAFIFCPTILLILFW